MLDTLEARRFVRMAANGRTRPSILGAVRTGEEEVEVFAKFSAGCDRGVTTLATEAVCAMLGADLGVPVPEPFVVTIDEPFIDLIPDTEAKAQMQASSRYAFGSRKLPVGYSAWIPNSPVEDHLVESATFTYAFDTLISNVDRMPKNPNCLCNGQRIGAFDHDLCLMNDGVLFWKPPWERSGAEFLAHPDKHVFYPALCRRPEVGTALDDFRQGWSVVTDARLEAYQAALPLEWVEADAVPRMIDYLAKARDHIDDAIAEIQRVLS